MALSRHLVQAESFVYALQCLSVKLIIGKILPVLMCVVAIDEQF